jgi:hypothetical protein
MNKMKISHPFLLVTLWITSVALGHAFATEPPIKEPDITAEDRNHWAFKPLSRPSIPSPIDREKAKNPIDLFVLRNLETQGLTFAEPADRQTLIRRLAFDLIGLPPTPDESEFFINDPHPAAYENQVERFLASPKYGERWAQHWLDLARYAESDGFEHDIVRTNAWRYRDWVIRAFNRDLPYNQFIQAQIAGDEIGNIGESDTLATGFLLAGPDMPDINLTEERRHIVLNEITSTVGAVFMGLGVGCAQCHDHKFDPISQADFYRLRSFFDNMAFPKRNKQLGHIIKENGPEPSTSYLAVRGDFRRQGPPITPAYPRIINTRNRVPNIRLITNDSSFRRAELARWLTASDHPLTSRVVMNRLWQHHFGKALVGTPNDFGTQGLEPSHPLLLDFLGTELIRSNWSLKQMHRLIVSSTTYRQASRGSSKAWDHGVETDPENIWLSRMNRRRLSGESLRDAMLAASLSFNDRQGGPSDRPPLPTEVHATLLRKNHWITSAKESDHHRRSIYVFVRRNLRYPMFDVFDRPDANASCAQRSLTTTAPQSLNLLNSEFSLRVSESMASIVINETDGKTDRAIDQLFLRILGRLPSSSEMDSLKDFLIQNPNALRGDDKKHRKQAFTEISLALFNLNEFLYVD